MSVPTIHSDPVLNMISPVNICAFSRVFLDYAVFHSACTCAFREARLITGSHWWSLLSAFPKVPGVSLKTWVLTHKIIGKQSLMPTWWLSHGRGLYWSVLSTFHVSGCDWDWFYTTSLAFSPTDPPCLLESSQKVNPGPKLQVLQVGHLPSM